MTYMIVSDLECCCMEALESPEGKIYLGIFTVDKQKVYVAADPGRFKLWTL